MNEPLSFYHKDYQLIELHLRFDRNLRDTPMPLLPSTLTSLDLTGSFAWKDPIHQLSHLQHLQLGNIDSLTDVSMFDRIDTVELRFCQNIVDITSLQNNRVIKIRQCRGIMNYCNA